MKKLKRLKTLTVRFFLLVVGLIVLTGPHPFLFLTDFKTQKTIGEVPLRLQDSFTVEWIHSVELTPWQETYRVPWFNGIELVQTSFRSFGAGVPADVTGAQLDIKNGWIVYSGLHQQRDRVIYLISKEDYKLSIGKQTWKLTDLLPLGTSLEFTVKWRPWWFRFLYKMQGEEVTVNESTNRHF